MELENHNTKSGWDVSRFGLVGTLIGKALAIHDGAGDRRIT